jgi:hypothetical protein
MHIYYVQVLRVIRLMHGVSIHVCIQILACMHHVVALLIRPANLQAGVSFFQAN